MNQLDLFKDRQRILNLEEWRDCERPSSLLAQVKDEYDALCASGEIRPTSSDERKVRIARGRDGRENVEAARRLCAKKGIDWRSPEWDYVMEDIPVWLRG